MKPKIGILICEISQERQYVSDAYIQAILRSGGLPLILPMVRSSSAIESYISLCDGFLFCGGNDITPLLFGQEPRKGIGQTDIALDLYQIRLMKQAIASRKPVFGICRGMQILNVAQGGSIHQDMSFYPDDTQEHMQHSRTRQEISHKVCCKKGSLLHKITGSYLFVNSFHHQTVDTPGEGISITAKSEDGCVEAIEMPSHPFVLGVQWHPESMFRNSFEMRHLFFYFVQKCL